MMQITEHKYIGTAGIRKVGEYRRSPGDIHLAIGAALHYARKNNKRMVVIPGNSYMNKVYHIATESSDIKSFTVAGGSDCYIVNIDGSTYIGDAK